jgi:hypothetical protein
MPVMFLVSENVVRSTEVQMAHSKYVALLVVMIALAVAVLGGVFEAVSFSGGLESMSDLPW